MYYQSAEELEYATVEILFDIKNRVGVITAALNYERGVPMEIVQYPRLEIMRNEKDTFSDEELRERMNFPEKLLEGYYLLVELGRHQL